MLLQQVGQEVAGARVVEAPFRRLDPLAERLLDRLMVGHDHRTLAPASALLGGAFLVACDTAARIVLAPAELPVGVVTALLGGPFFIWLLRRSLVRALA